MRQRTSEALGKYENGNTTTLTLGETTVKVDKVGLIENVDYFFHMSG